MRLEEGLSCIYPPEQTRPTTKCFRPQIWFYLDIDLYMFFFSPLIHSSECVTVHSVQSIFMVLVFSPKLPGSFSYLSVFVVQIFWTSSIENKLYTADIDVLNSFDYLPQAPRRKQKTLASHFAALSHCLVCYCVMNRPPLPPLGEENMFSSSLWQEGIVKVK